MNATGLLRKSINAILTACLLAGPLIDLHAENVQPRDTIALWSGTKVPYGSEVTLMTFIPENPNGVSAVVCPGGSYHWLDQTGEGTEVGEWLCSHGITAFVLYYRTAGVPEFICHTRILFRGKRHPDMIQDAQKALLWVWEHADEYGVDRNRTGIVGFSAGGHLAMSTACFSSTDFLKDEGIITDADLRPAFVASIYPVVTMREPYVHRRSRRGLLGDNRIGSKKMKDSLSLELHIPDNCPPVFIVNCIDDPVVDYRNSVLLDSALTSRGAEHRYIQYRTGKHGFGVSDWFGSPECREWKNELLVWLKGYYPSL